MEQSAKTYLLKSLSELSEIANHMWRRHDATGQQTTKDLGSYEDATAIIDLAQMLMRKIEHDELK
jgi:hypothetical protein